MEASQHSLLAACFTLHSINATLAIVPQRGAGGFVLDGTFLHQLNDRQLLQHQLQLLRIYFVFDPFVTSIMLRKVGNLSSVHVLLGKPMY
jgi:hypothetical protein